MLTHQIRLRQLRPEAALSLLLSFSKVSDEDKLDAMADEVTAFLTDELHNLPVGVCLMGRLVRASSNESPEDALRQVMSDYRQLCLADVHAAAPNPHNLNDVGGLVQLALLRLKTLCPDDATLQGCLGLAAGLALCDPSGAPDCVFRKLSDEERLKTSSRTDWNEPCLRVMDGAGTLAAAQSYLSRVGLITHVVGTESALGTHVVIHSRIQATLQTVLTRDVLSVMASAIVDILRVRFVRIYGALTVTSIPALRCFFSTTVSVGKWLLRTAADSMDALLLLGEAGRVAHMLYHDYPTAIELNMTALDISERVEGTASQSTAASYNIIGGIHHAKGDLDEHKLNSIVSGHPPSPISNGIPCIPSRASTSNRGHRLRQRVSHGGPRHTGEGVQHEGAGSATEVLRKRAAIQGAATLAVQVSCRGAGGAAGGGWGVGCVRDCEAGAR